MALIHCASTSTWVLERHDLRAGAMYLIIGFLRLRHLLGGAKLSLEVQECAYPNYQGQVPSGSSSRCKRRRTSGGARGSRFFSAMLPALGNRIACSMKPGGGTNAGKISS